MYSTHRVQFVHVVHVHMLCPCMHYVCTLTLDYGLPLSYTSISGWVFGYNNYGDVFSHLQMKSSIRIIKERQPKSESLINALK